VFPNGSDSEFSSDWSISDPSKPLYDLENKGNPYEGLKNPFEPKKGKKGKKPKK
jgi:hypothetical protein